MEVIRRGPAVIILDNGDSHSVTAEIAVEAGRGRGKIWGPPNLSAFDGGSKAQLEMSGFIFPIAITASGLSDPAEFILTGEFRRIEEAL